MIYLDSLFDLFDWVRMYDCFVSVIEDLVVWWMYQVMVVEFW